MNCYMGKSMKSRQQHTLHFKLFFSKVHFSYNFTSNVKKNNGNNENYNIDLSIQIKYKTREGKKRIPSYPNSVG